MLIYCQYGFHRVPTHIANGLFTRGVTVKQDAPAEGMRGQGGGAPRKSPFAAAGTVGRPSQYGDPVAAPPLDHDRRAGFLRKAIKEAAVLSRRAKFGWRHLSSGSLAFQSGSEQRTFAIGKKLGEGGYSTIWRVHEWQPDGSERQFAVKRVILDRRDSEQLALVEHEISVMRSLPPHPNVVELIGTCKRKRGSAGEQDEVFLLLELCRGGSFAELLIARGEANTPLAPSEAAAAFHDMALGVAHMHQQPSPIAQRDVKPENFILNDSDGRWRLCDFGSATTRTFRYRADGSTTQYEVAEEEDRVHRYSTPQYRAPEMNDLRRGEPVGVAVDVWALGVALYKALFLQDLFGTPGEERLGVLNFDPSKKLAPHALPRAAPHSAGASAVLLDLLRLCLTPSPAQRPTATDVLQWLHARSDQVGGGGGIKAAWPFSRPPGAHVAGRLTIRGLEARNVFPKAASRGGVKPYVLLTCGGTRRVTSIAPKGHTASWGAEALEASTHAMQHVELTVWAHHRRTTHDFLGVVTLSLPTLVPEPTQQARVEGRVVTLQRRSHKSHVSGELCFSLSWEPFATSPADGHGASGGGSGVAAAASTAAVATAAGGARPGSPHLIRAASPPVEAHGPPAPAGGGAGSFWAGAFADEFASFEPAEAAVTHGVQALAAANRASGGGGGGSGGHASGDPGSFWASSAAADSAWAASPPQSNPPAVFPQSSASFGGAAPIFTPTAQQFDAVDASAAPWDASRTGTDGGPAGGGDPGSFWATFDAPSPSPQGTALPSAMPGGGAPGNLIDLGESPADSTSRAAAPIASLAGGSGASLPSVWNDLAGLQ